ncbi:TetR/AcrR family transcriptional regulator, partial [Acinetobacter baumannii]
PRREHLIEVAHALFNRYGFHQAGIDMIMRESGVSKTTLYKYFPSKEDLVLEVLKLRSARILGGMEQRLNSLLAAKPDATVKARIGAILDVIEEWIDGSAFFGCNFVRAAAEYAEADH